MKRSPLFFIISIIILAIVVWVGFMFITTHNSNKLVDKGLTLQQQGDFPGAKSAYRAALDVSECNALAWNYLGNVYRLEKEYTEAWEAYLSAISCDPRLEAVYRNASATYYLWGDKEARPEENQLEEVLLQGVRVNSKSVIILEQIVKFYNRYDNSEQAAVYQEKLDQIRE